MKDEAERPAVATAAEFTVPIEEIGGLLEGLADEPPPPPRILRAKDELLRFVAEAQAAT